MRPFPRIAGIIALAVCILAVAALGRELGSREARQKIAEALGLDKADRVHIKSVKVGMGGEAIVEAQFDAAFRFAADKDGKWSPVDVRTGDRDWQSIELVQTAVRKEKTLRTTADMRTIATALEAFRRERGFYVSAESSSALIDNLAPRYLPMVIRLDAWSHEFAYRGTATGYRLASLGPDGKLNTPDDIVIQDGQLLKGATTE